MATEPGMAYDVWHLDTTGQADRFGGSVSTLLDAKAIAEREPLPPEIQALCVWVTDVAQPSAAFYVGPDGAVLFLVEERSLGAPFPDRLYAARGERALLGAGSTVPNALAPRPAVEAVATAQEKARSTAGKGKDGPRDHPAASPEKDVLRK